MITLSGIHTNHRTFVHIGRAIGIKQWGDTFVAGPFMLRCQLAKNRVSCFRIFEHVLREPPNGLQRCVRRFLCSLVYFFSECLETLPCAFF